MLQVRDDVQRAFNGAQADGKAVSLAAAIVLGGCAAVEQGARNAGHDVTDPFTPGRADASQEQTDVESLAVLAVLEPTADEFRNYRKGMHAMPASETLVDRTQLPGRRHPR